MSTQDLNYEQPTVSDAAVDNSGSQDIPQKSKQNVYCQI